MCLSDCCLCLVVLAVEIAARITFVAQGVETCSPAFHNRWLQCAQNGEPKQK
jgi:hypothetical protein